MMVEKGHPLYAVRDVFNAIVVSGDVVDDVMFYGRGAGSFPTASAVVADVIDAAKHQGINLNVFWKGEPMTLSPFESQKRRFFTRVSDANVEAAKQNFPEAEMIDAGIAGEKGFVTGLMTEKDFADKAEKTGVISSIRMRGR